MNNATKIEIIMDKLSKERQNHINALIEGAINKIKNNSNQNTTYNLEITERFDKEEPFQFVWLSLSFSIQNLGFAIPTPNGMANAIGTNLVITDIEIYPQSDIDGWLDHVKRIKEQEATNLLKEAEVKNNASNNKNIDNQVEVDTDDEDDRMDEQKAVEELEWLFTPLFSSPFPKEYSTDEYIKIFQRYSSIFANRIISGFINIQDEPIQSIKNKIDEALIMLTSEFDKCDFTKFSKEQLEQLGFVNWRNKTLMIPIWAYPIILKNNNGLIVIDVQGEEWVIGKEYIFTEDKNGAMMVGIPFKKVKSEVFDSTIDTYEIIAEYKRN